MKMTREEFIRICSETYDDLAVNLDLDKQNFYDYETSMVDILKSQNLKVMQASLGALPKNERSKKKS